MKVGCSPTAVPIWLCNISAIIAVLVAVSLQDLRPNPQDTSSFYLEKLYQLQADLNVLRLSTPSAVATPPAFSPPRYALWVNSLGFLSLVISLSCAMLVTLLQQWSRRYLTIKLFCDRF